MIMVQLIIETTYRAPGRLAHSPIWESVEAPNDKLFFFLFLKNMLTLLESYIEKISSQ